MSKKKPNFNVFEDSWVIVAGHIEGELKALTAMLESQISHDHSQHIRGQIRAYRAILSLPSKKPTPTINIEEY